jgi:predicted O-linked N-acetylglucosamine transferase (SPINDLY family)
LQDEITRRIKAASSEWNEVARWNDEQLFDKIRADKIDILFDMAGHTSHNRMLVFARKPSPIQISWAGYVGTTGLEAMDYVLSDRFQTPPSVDDFYRERILRMPDGYICFDIPANGPPVSPLPALERGAVTFCCFNNPAKITPQAVEVWSRIMHRLPGSRMIFKYGGWSNADVVQRYVDMFASHAIDVDRLEFLGFSPHAEFLAEYHRVDLALDTFPYSGGLTTCEALWMGVPVVTCPMETFASRHSLSHTSNVGLTETVARDLQDYEEIVVSLATNLPHLAKLRSTLRDRVEQSPLCNGPRFAENWHQIMRSVWREWCARRI